MSVWDPIKYGFNVCYWLTVEGIPVVWIERETTLTLPTSYAQDASLVIDKSSKIGQLVDRATGIGRGFPLTWQLLDTATTRQWLQQPSAISALSTDIAYNAATIPVESSADFDASGAAWIGIERIEYTGKTVSPDTLTGATRGTAGSTALAAYAGQLGGQVSNKPRWWRGRQVRLYAAPIDPAGYFTGTTLEDSSEEIWRGYVNDGPNRSDANWQIDALALDRKLDNPLQDSISGTVLEFGIRYPVYQSQTISLHIAGWDASGPSKSWEFWIQFAPFSGLPNGALIGPEAAAKALQDAWNNALPNVVNVVGGATDATTYLGSLGYTKVGANYFWRLEIKANALPSGQSGVLAWRPWFANQQTTINGVWAPGASAATPTTIPLWLTNGDHVNGYFLPIGGGATFNPGLLAPSIIVKTDVAVASIPTAGTVIIDGKPLHYSKSETSNDIIKLAALKTGDSTPVPQGAQLIGKSVEIATETSGTPKSAMLTILESSGTGQLGANDTAGFGFGYALDGNAATANSAIETGSFSTLAQGPLSETINTRAGYGGKSFADVFGGLLSLAQRGVVIKSTDGGLYDNRQRLALVSTERGSSLYTRVITDADLLTTQSAPAKTIRKQLATNIVRVKTPIDSENPDIITIQDVGAVMQQGAKVSEHALPLAGKIAVGLETIKTWAKAKLQSDQLLQAIELKVAPWVNVEIGDSIRLQTTHHAVWTWATGNAGYTGAARVLGIARKLDNTETTLTLLLEGGLSVSGLSPAAPVLAYDDPINPTYVDVPRRYFAHFNQTVELQSPFKLIHYVPGDGNEGSGGDLDFDAVTDTGAVCRLTVNAINAVTLTAQSYLTLPIQIDATDYQNAFAHTDDGTFWGA